MPMERRKSAVYDHYPQAQDGAPDGPADQAVPLAQVPDNVTSLASLQQGTLERDQARAAASYPVGPSNAVPNAAERTAITEHAALILADPEESKDQEVVIDGLSGYRRHRYEPPLAWTSKTEVAWLDSRRHSASAMRRHSACSSADWAEGQ